MSQPAKEPVPHETTDPAVLSEIYRLRVEVWRASGLNPPALTNNSEGIWTDDHDSHGTHWVIESGGSVLASARLCQHQHVADAPEGDYYLPLGIPEDGPFACMSRLVVHPSAGGRGFALALDKIRLERAASWNCRMIIVYSSNPRRIPALLGLDFELAGVTKPVGDVSCYCFVKRCV